MGVRPPPLPGAWFAAVAALASLLVVHPVFAQSGRVSFLTRAQLEAAGCFDPKEGPALFCTFNARNYTRKLTIDSRYRVRVSGRSESFDAAWCGLTCNIPNTGPGTYEVSYYSAANHALTAPAAWPPRSVADLRPR